MQAWPCGCFGGVMSGTLFNKVDYTLSSLIDAISNGQLGLPDIQRPFVWKNVKVRDLFDSMYRGYPVGYFLFWETGVGPGTRQIGTDQKQLVPSRVIVDGQQRLTSLYAVMKGRRSLRSLVHRRSCALCLDMNCVLLPFIPDRTSFSSPHRSLTLRWREADSSRVDTRPISSDPATCRRQAVLRDLRVTAPSRSDSPECH